jgi:hypothetical protein
MRDFMSSLRRRLCRPEADESEYFGGDAMRLSDPVLTRSVKSAAQLALALLLLVAFDAGRSQAHAGSFHTVTATDGTFSVSIPADWHIQSDQVNRFMAWGPQGQSVGWGLLPIIDRTHYARYQNLVGPNLAQQVYPIVSDPLAPAQLLLSILPRANPNVQAIRILGEKLVAAPSMANGSFILYGYTLVPGLGERRTFIPPPLLAYRSIAMKGSVLIETTAPNADGMWTMEFWGAYAPQARFSENLRIFDKVFRTLRYDTRRIVQLVAEQQRQRGAIVGSMIRGEQASWEHANATITQFGSNMIALQQQTSEAFNRENLKAGEGAMEALGGPTHFVDPEGHDYYFNQQQHNYRYNCVSGFGGTAQYYYSNTQDCAKLGVKYGRDLRPLTAK